MRPHAVCMPCPAQGHIHATLKLAKLLHSRGFHVTFVHTEFNYNRISLAGGGAGGGVKGLDDFRFETIPDGLPPSDPGTNQDMDSLCFHIRNTFASPFRDLVKRLNAAGGGCGGGPPVTCIVSDTFTSFTIDVAEELGIPCVLFCSVSACGYMGFLKYNELAERGIAPFESDDDPNNEHLDTTIGWIPGGKNIRLRDLPRFSRAQDPNRVIFNFLVDETKELSTPSLSHHRQHLRRPRSASPRRNVPVPPAHLRRRPPQPALPQHARRPARRGRDEQPVAGGHRLHGLAGGAGRAPGSVVYVNFGSLAVMTGEQLVEFAWGLASSGHDFLWIIRPDAVDGDSAVLPAEFVEGTRGRGMMAGWCGQEEVLMHPAVGGFLTHCGWNSMMESVSAGVPMICWPYYSDQQINSWYACSEWGVGLEMGKGVGRGRVEGLIREMMGGDKGKEMRRKALEWKEAAENATKFGGRSFVNLDRVVKEVLCRGVE